MSGHDRLYGALHTAREKLCIAQTDVTEDAHRAELQSALDLIDRLGVWYAPDRWSKYNTPAMPGEEQAWLRRCWLCYADLTELWDHAPREADNERLRWCPRCHYAVDFSPEPAHMGSVLRRLAGLAAPCSPEDGE